MHGPNDHSPTALELARRAFVTTVKATSGAQRGWAKLVDQARRAASGVPLQLTESDSRVGKDRLQLRRIAYGSAREARMALMMLAEVEAIVPAEAETAIDLLDRVCAMTWRLMQYRL